jgi:hypothetical protein
MTLHRRYLLNHTSNRGASPQLANTPIQQLVLSIRKSGHSLSISKAPRKCTFCQMIQDDSPASPNLSPTVGPRLAGSPNRNRPHPPRRNRSRNPHHPQT